MHGGTNVNFMVREPKTGRAVPFVHQGPIISLPFGVSDRDVREKGHKSAKAGIAFPTVRVVNSGMENETFTGDKSDLDYFKFIQSLDEFNKQKAFEKCKEWNGKTKSKEIISELYHSNVYIGPGAKEGKYSPTFNTKIYAKNGENGIKFATKFYELEPCTRSTQGAQLLDGSYYTPKLVPFEQYNGKRISKCIPLLKCTGMWFKGGQFGTVFELVQLLVFPDDNNFDDCAITFGEPVDDGPVFATESESDESYGQKRNRDEAELPDDGPVSKHFNAGNNVE
jgi:hypothetical protein